MAPYVCIAAKASTSQQARHDWHGEESGRAIIEHTSIRRDGQWDSLEIRSNRERRRSGDFREPVLCQLSDGGRWSDWPQDSCVSVLQPKAGRSLSAAAAGSEGR